MKAARKFDLFSQWSITTKVHLLARLASAMLVALALWFAYSEYQRSLADRQHLAHSAVDSTEGVLKWAHGLETSGAATRAQAQDLAKAAIKQMRYAGGEYFWINDMDARIVMHPIKPALDGTDASTMKDPNGKLIFIEFAATVKKQGGGFVSYLWPKPGHDEPVKKVSYVAGFAPWGWVIGSGLYIDDLHAQLMATLGRLAIGLGLALGLLLLLMRGVVSSITSGVGEVVQSARAVAEGDLTRRINDRATGEIGDLFAAMRQMNEGLRHMVGTVRDAAQTMERGAADIAFESNAMGERSEHDAATLQQTAAATAQLRSTVKQNADNSRQASQLALDASSVASRGGQVVGQVVGTMKGINESSKKIADIIGVIDGIAFQTNILALNAAVEAARAGEQGRGFAVVATEVRSLAQRSAGAAREIKDLIIASVQRVEQGSQLVDQAGATMGEVVAAIERVTDIVGRISQASAEQSTGIEQVAQALTAMEQATQQNLAMVEQSAVESESLREQAQRLVQTVSAFKIDGGNAPQAAPADLPQLVLQPALYKT